MRRVYIPRVIVKIIQTIGNIVVDCIEFFFFFRTFFVSFEEKKFRFFARRTGVDD